MPYTPEEKARKFRELDFRINNLKHITNHITGIAKTLVYWLR